MDDIEQLEMRSRAMSDQVRAMLHEHRADILRVSSTDPEQWTQDDRMVAQMVLAAMCGFLLTNTI